MGRRAWAQAASASPRARRRCGAGGQLDSPGAPRAAIAGAAAKCPPDESLRSSSKRARAIAELAITVGNQEQDRLRGQALSLIPDQHQRNHHRSAPARTLCARYGHRSINQPASRVPAPWGWCLAMTLISPLGICSSERFVLLRPMQHRALTRTHDEGIFLARDPCQRRASLIRLIRRQRLSGAAASRLPHAPEAGS
jgi:hypothetical protein